MIQTGTALRYLALFLVVVEFITGLASARTAVVAADAVASLGSTSAAGIGTGSAFLILVSAAGRAVFHAGILYGLGELLIWLAGRERFSSEAHELP